MKNKYLRECEKSKSLQMMNSQLNAMVEKLGSDKDNKSGIIF